MHILIIHQAFASLDEPGGTRHFEFARRLAARGHHVTIIASPVSYMTGEPTLIPPRTINRGAELAAGEIEILRARVYSAHHKSFIHRILAFFSFMFSSFFTGLNVKRVDVVWGTSPPIFQGLTAWALARLKGARFLFEVRDLWPQFAVAVGVLKNPMLIAASEWLERFLYRHADEVIVNSPGFMDHVKRGGAGSIKLIPNGADPSMFDPFGDGADFRRMYNLDDKFVVLYAGAHGMSNDLDIVLHAAKLLRSPNIQIVLLGDGKEKPALQAMAKSLSLTNVTFASSVPKNGMPHALAAADACIAILKPLEEYKTTYPNKVFDYMAAGRPVLLAIDGVMRVVIETAGCGLFVEPGNAVALADAIRELADDRQASRLMGMKGRNYLDENFNRDKIAGELIEVIEGIPMKTANI